MSWTCRFVDKPPLRTGGYFAGTVEFEKLSVGDICFYHHEGVPCTDRAHLEKLHLSAHYFAHNASRPPLIVMLPGKLYFLIDSQCYSGDCVTCGKKRRKCKCGDAHKPKGYYDGWKVTGVPPKITVHPSINFEDSYHGWLKDGVISDDCEGRKFPA
jgi:hypothetical protein